MRQITRLAILDRGEPAVQALSAVATYNRGSGQPAITTVVAHTELPARPWYAREADETLMLRPGQAAVPLLPEPLTVSDAQFDSADVVALLVSAGIDAVWIGQVPCGDHVGLVAACESAGLVVLGPDSATITRLADPAGLAEVLTTAEVLAAADVPPAGGSGASVASLRAVDVDVLADDAAVVWALPPREVSVTDRDRPVLAETPAPGLTDELTDRLTGAARRIAAAAGYRGAGTVQFLVDPATGTVQCRGVDTLARAEHTLVEETTGANPLALRIELALGGRLDLHPPTGSGHAVAVTLLAHDPVMHDPVGHGSTGSGLPGSDEVTGADRAAGHNRCGGSVELLALPIGTGVRVDAGLREGDQVDADLDPQLATITGWGRTRAEAIRRLVQALERTTVVLQRGASNRSTLLGLLRHPDLLAGPVPLGWYAARHTDGSLVPAPHPVALVAAAVQAYEADLSIVRTAFLAGAERGRPERLEEVGALMALSYRGADYRLRVDRTSADTYRVHDGATVDVTVDTLGDFERRLTVGGRRYAVVATEQGATFRLEIDGVAHAVQRDDGVVVRTGWPALVSQVLVTPGQRVEAGQPVAVLESMKMVSTVTAPFDGIVTSVAVLANAQVERGAPLLRVRSLADAPSRPASGDGTRVDLAALAAGAATPADRGCQSVFEPLVNYLLGYDLDPARFKAVTAQYAALARTADADDAPLLACEDVLLDLFGEIGSLYRPRVEADDTLGGEASEVNTQEYFIAFLRWLDADRAGLPERYRARLEKALGRYGVTGLTRTRALEQAIVWMFRSFSRVPQLSPVVAAILQRRLTHHGALVAAAGPELRLRLERLVWACEGRQQLVADLARDVLFHYFDEPVLEQGITDVRHEMTEHLAAIAADPTGPDSEDHYTKLAWCPYKLRGILLSSWLDGQSAGPAGAGLRAAVRTTYARRFYRIRPLRQVRSLTLDTVELGAADYTHDGRQIHLVTGYLPMAQLPRFADAVAEHLREVDPAYQVVVDLVLWRAERERVETAELAAELAEQVDRSRFGRRLHRLDLTVSSRHSDEPDDFLHQHVTFRQDESGRFVEDLLHRDLHPMLGKRLDLWRLSNFELTRLPAPEDVYLFVGTAKDNPKDTRLFALAEIRDLVPSQDPHTGTVTYPRAQRTGMLALAAMRSVLAGYPQRERPVANRLVLSVRPPFTVAPSHWQPILASYEPLARGAGLEKVVMHVKVPMPEPDGTTVLEEKVIFVEGIGRSGMTVRIGEPGPNPIRPLTRYAQKLLTAKRFGSPYPYEIAQMLTPDPGVTSMFPPGEFIELDLGPDDRLVPVDRPPAENTAHLVVGLITNYTELVPEGMTRVALMSDPTQGLGNLSEPECRRINAALAFAAENQIPVEWYAVSSGALIAMDSGTENMDWIALTLRRIIEFTQAGGEINIIVTGINVGGQPYWNAEATMLMHTRGILVMTPASAMVLTGKQALDFSGAVSADDNFGIGGYDRVMGPNGQAQYWAPSFQDACALLMDHYRYTYVVPGERFPRRRDSADPLDRDVRSSPHAAIPGSTFTTVADVFDHASNPERKLPFDMRSVMRAVADTDCEPLERWRHWQHSDTSIVWDASIGGIPVCLLGLESRTVPRTGFVPADGPSSWTSGTLFPQASRKIARAVNAASGNRPLVVLANLSGFDGSPESMRKWQLEYGAEIGRAVTNFDGPIVFVVVSRYHGGAFVVFSKALTESMEIAAVEGSYASVIGGAPAAATVFAREVKQRTERDARVVQARAAAGEASGVDAGALRARAAELTEAVRSEKLGEVADEFDSIHTIERALRVGSVDRIISAAELRPYIVDALERGMAAFT